MLKPVRLTLGDHKTEILDTDFVCVNLRLRTKADELITRRRQCVIWDVPSEKIILGSDLLETLGIEPKSALDALILTKKNQGPAIEGEENKETCNDSDDESFSEVINEDIAAGIKNLLISAGNNGLPEKWLRRLEVLIRRYWNIWRIHIGPLLSGYETDTDDNFFNL